MTGTRTARTQALALRIGELLDRGISPESIRAGLIRRNMPPQTATELVRRVILAKARARTRLDPLTRPTPSKHPGTRRTRVRNAVRAGARWFARGRTGAPALVLCAALTFFGGRQLVRGAEGSGTAEVVARLTRELENTGAEVFRLEAELVSRKEQAQELESLRARIGAGPVRFASRGAYRAAVDDYQRQLTHWNATLGYYRQVSRDYTTLVAVLNAKSDSLAALSRGRGAGAKLEN